MSILQTEPAEMNFGITVRHIVAVAVGIEEQVGRIEHPDATPPSRHRGRDVQTVDEGLVAIEDAVAVRVFMDRDLVATPDVMRRWCRNLVIDRSPDAVVAEHPQSGRVGILKILHHPEPSAIIEAQTHRLANDWLGEDQVDLQIVGKAKGR
jgi:hypothetical protein